MNRLATGILVGAAVGLAAGAAAMRWMDTRSSVDASGARPAIIRDIRDVPTITMDETEAHRADRFASLTTLEDTLMLPSDFAQTEALYVLAGRSNSAEVQNLVFQATRIADTSDRRAAMSILFSRLADIDPHSAVAIAGQAPFTEDQWVEGSFWRNWSRLNLDAALAAAAQLTPLSRKQRAAQAIYAAHGFGGNDITAHIERELGIAPDRWVKSQYLESLAAESPASAVAYALQLGSLAERLEALGSLGAFLGRTAPRTAEGYGRLIENRQMRDQYQAAVMNALAYSDPALVIENWLASPNTTGYAGTVSTALSQLAQSDLDAALGYFDAVTDPQLRPMLAAGILQSMARSDPRKALDWARANDRDSNGQLLTQAVAAVATTDPALALEAAAAFEPAAQRDDVLAMVISSTVQSDPDLAVAALDQMPGGQQKNSAAQQLMMAWSQIDAKAAMTWALAHRAEFGDRIMGQAAGMFIHQYPRDAIQLLPSLDARTATSWGQQIVGVLANYESVAAAQAFVEQYKGTADYPAMQSALIPQIAIKDPALARAMADQMPPGNDRDTVIASLIAQSASTDPHGALAWAETIADEQQRQSAVGTAVMTWSYSDPAAANRYVSALRPGATRDAAVVALLNSPGEPDASLLRLISTIDDEQKRSQAKLAYAYRLARHDMAAAEAFLEDLDLSDRERQQIEQFMQNYRGRMMYD